MKLRSEESAMGDRGEINILKVIVTTKATTFGFLGQTTMQERLEIERLDHSNSVVIEQDWYGTRDVVIRVTKKAEKET